MSNSSSILSGGATAIDLDDLSEKYQRLLQEFSRVKAQHSILKKAVLNEQMNSTKLVDQIKVKEQELRKHSQEIEVLSFHNKGLTKKVESLQQNNNKVFKTSWISNNGKKMIEQLNVQLEAATLDLENKIYENERLHRLIDDLNTEKQIEFELERKKMKENQKKLLEIQEELRLSDDKNNQKQQGLIEDKQKVESTLFKLIQNIEKLKSEAFFQHTNNLKITEAEINKLINIQALFGNNLFILGLNEHQPIDHSESLNYLNDYISNISFGYIKTSILYLVDYLKLLKQVENKRINYFIKEHSDNWKEFNLGQFLDHFDNLISNIEQIIKAIEEINNGIVTDHKVWSTNDTIKNQNTPQITLIIKNVNTILYFIKDTIIKYKLIESTNNNHLIDVLNQLIGYDWIKINTDSMEYSKKSFNLISSFHLALNEMFFNLKSYLKNQFNNSNLNQLQSILLLNFTILLPIEVLIDRIFICFERWFAFYITIDDNTLNYLNKWNNTDLPKSELDIKVDKFISSLNYKQTINYDSVTINNNDLHDLYKWNLQILNRVEGLNMKLEQLENDVQDKQSIIHNLNDKLKYTESTILEYKNKLVDFENIIQNNNIQFNQKEEEINGLLNQIDQLSKEVEELKEKSKNQPVSNINHTNGLNNGKESKVNSVNQNGATQELQMHFKTPINLEGSYIEKMIKKQYETKVIQLTKQLESVDAKATRYYHALKEMNNKIEFLQNENQNAKSQLQLKDEQIIKDKEHATLTETRLSEQVKMLSDELIKVNESLATLQNPN